MSKYTQTISSILRENARPGEDVNDLHDIGDIAKRCLFDGYGIQAVPSDYRDRLITGFSLHFFNDEIGMETLPLFKMGLSDKLYNNGDYIGQVYAALDKQLFSDYKTRATTGHNTSVINMSEGVDKAGSITNAKSGSDSTRHTGTASDTKTGTDTTENTGTSASVKSGNDTVKNTGTVGNLHTGQNRDDHENTDTLTKSGSEVTSGNASGISSKSGSDSVVSGGTETSNKTSGSTSTNESSDTGNTVGGETSNKTAGSTSTNESDEAGNRSGLKETVMSGIESTTNTGGHFTKKAGSELDVYGKKTTQTGGEKTFEMSESSGDTDTNAAAYNLDTPMDNIELLRAGQTNTNPPSYVPFESKGMGIAASYAKDKNNNQSKTRYMSNASLQDSSAVTSGDAISIRDSSQSETENQDGGHDIHYYSYDGKTGADGYPEGEGVFDYYQYGTVNADPTKNLDYEKTEKSYGLEQDSDHGNADTRRKDSTVEGGTDTKHSTSSDTASSMEESTRSNITEESKSHTSSDTSSSIEESGVTRSNIDKTTYGSQEVTGSTENSTLSFNQREDENASVGFETHQFNETNTRTDNTQSKTEYDSTQTRTDNLTQQTEYDTTSTHSQNLQDTVQYGSTNTQVINTNDSKVGNTSKNDTLAGDEISTALNLEMIYRSMPLLNKVWEIFDELFMSIY